MNRLLLFTGILLLSGSQLLAAQPIHPRAQAILVKRFPQAELVEWGRTEDGFQASFYDRDAQRVVEMEFDRRGRWQQTTLDLDTEALTPEILDYIDTHFEQHYSSAFELRVRRRRKPRYGLVIDTPTHIYSLIFESDGRLLEEHIEGLDGG